jgi:hypothetical protein
VGEQGTRDPYRGGRAQRHRVQARRPDSLRKLYHFGRSGLAGIAPADSARPAIAPDGPRAARRAPSSGSRSRGCRTYITCTSGRFLSGLPCRSQGYTCAFPPVWGTSAGQCLSSRVGHPAGHCSLPSGCDGSHAGHGWADGQ